MKLSSRYPSALYWIFLFVLLVNFILGKTHGSNQDFNETENAAKAIRKLLSGEIDTIKLENGDELKTRSNNDEDEAYSRNNSSQNNNNYSFISNSEVETSETNSLKKKNNKDMRSNIVENMEDFYILDNESIETIAKVFAIKNEFNESEVELFEQSLKDIIKSLNN
ncbi:conserved Plasmodium protein, unknown function [Plasmodium ovale]|uniref:Uncharacterized protein n=2 Tax=Plasmodium ovale TaxID=36330 RepID=A0A1A8VLS0_PLAOA|nr:conserved Plasmodium protein, unknown function [Plasmodium ovale curtisi]SBS80593.1 conserved Plasmodium protein, unknown function [Plasmodium ovale curtisi]SCA48187.1 conserved Plasmodium protein, unknown function [Plasmodium ovale]